MVDVMMTLFALVVVGYAAGRLGYLGGDFDRGLSRLVINITCPALILSSAMTGELPDRRFILPLLLISLVTYALLALAAFLMPRLLTRRKTDEGVLGFALMFGNVGFMGYPVVASVFGREAVFYAAVLNVVNTFAVFTIGTLLITGRGEQEEGRFLKKVVWSSPMISAYLTMALVALGIKNVPAAVSQSLTMLGNITVPAALLIVGSSMSQLPLRALLGNLTVFLTAALRLVLLPLGVYYITRALGFSDFVVNINTLVVAMPVATYGTILCLKYGKETALMAEVTFVSTLLSMLSIPLLTNLLGF